MTDVEDNTTRAITSLKQDYENKIQHIIEDKVHAGNMTWYHTPPVLNQATYKRLIASNGRSPCRQYVQVSDVGYLLPGSL